MNAIRIASLIDSTTITDIENGSLNNLPKSVVEQEKNYMILKCFTIREESRSNKKGETQNVQMDKIVW